MAVAAPRAHADLLVSSHNADKVVRFDETTGDYIDDFVGVTRPAGVLFGPDGNLYISSATGHQVLRYNGTTLDTFVSGNGLNWPLGLIFDSGGNLYVSSFEGNQVLRFDSSGNPNPAPGQSGAVFAAVTYPQGLVFRDDYLYVSSMTTGKVWRYDQTGSGSVFASDPNSIMGLVFGPDDNLYVSSYGSNTIQKYDGTTGASLGTFASVSTPIGLLFGPDNNLYVAREVGNIYRYNGTTGAFIDDFATVSQPSCLTFTNTDPVTLAYVPEASTWVLFSLGLAALAVARGRRRKGSRSGG
jgi:sugar lactone lactonase YvrE